MERHDSLSADHRVESRSKVARFMSWNGMYSYTPSSPMVSNKKRRAGRRLCRRSCAPIHPSERVSLLSLVFAPAEASGLRFLDWTSAPDDISCIDALDRIARVACQFLRWLGRFPEAPFHDAIASCNWSMISSAIARDAVAAGLGALSTCKARSWRPKQKSCTSSPVGDNACARTPAPP